MIGRQVGDEPGPELHGQDGEAEDFAIGKGKPPPGSQFQKGNKMGKGRKPGSKNLKTLVNEALDLKTPAKINGKSVRLPKMELGMHQLATKTAGGDLKAIAMAIDLKEKYGLQDLEQPSEEEQKINFDALLEFFVRYLALREAGGDDAE